jgi:hypothetical protein
MAQVVELLTSKHRLWFQTQYHKKKKKASAYKTDEVNSVQREFWVRNPILSPSILTSLLCLKATSKIPPLNPQTLRNSVEINDYGCLDNKVMLVFGLGKDLGCRPIRQMHPDTLKFIPTLFAFPATILSSWCWEVGLSVCTLMWWKEQTWVEPQNCCLLTV